MKLEPRAEDWLNRYIKETTLFMPLTGRKELVRELTSDLMDKLEDTGEETVTEEAMISFLKEQGHPYGSSRLYTEQKPLLSAGMMPLFQLVTFIVSAVLTGVSFFGFFFNQDQGFLQWIAQTIAMLVSVLGWMVLVFSIIDRIAPHWKAEVEEEEWNPENLSPLKEDQHNWAESIATWVFSLIFIYLFTAQKDKIGVWYREGEEWIFLKVLNSGFYRLLPFYIIGMIWDSLIAGVYRIRKGWTPLSRIMDLLKSGFDMAITFFILRRGWQYLFLEGALEGTKLETLKNLSAFGQKLFPAILILTLIGTLVETIKKSTRLLKS